MANDEHLDLLTRGVECWNEWRKRNPYTQPNLSEANLSELDLSMVNLEKADLRLVNLCEANLYYANLRNADLSEADLRKTNLSDSHCSFAIFDRAEMPGVNLVNADLSEAKLYRTDLSHSNLSKANLSQSNLCWANLSNANLSEANFSKSNMKHVNLYKANLFCANGNWANLSKAYILMAHLYRAQLFGANLYESKLTESDLSYSDLRWTDMKCSDLTDVDLTNADLSYASLHQTNLFHSNFVNTRLCETVLKHAIFEETSLVNLNLGEVKDIETCVHYGPSVVDCRTLQKSQMIPRPFLEGCGMPHEIIETIEEMKREYDCCYISFGKHDDAFASFLNQSLQSKNVRCWLSPEDRKHGDKITQHIEGTIRDREKILLVFSEPTVNSHWIRREIESIFQKEGELNRTILVPVCLDSSFEKSSDSLFVDIRKSRSLYDFCDWKDEAVFEGSLEKLILSLIVPHADLEDRSIVV